MTTRVEWEGRLGAEWAKKSEALDLLLGPAGEAAIAALAPQRDWRVLDLGCGAGSTTFRLAEIVGAGGRAVGVDVSPDLVEMARARAKDILDGRATFILADAATAALPGPFDGLYSRCGSMFFDDPVAAFAHIRGMMHPSAPFAAACWRAAALNEWAALPLRVTADLLGADAAPSPSGAPGPFAWAEPEHFEPALAEAGWRDVGWAEVRGRAAIGAGEATDPVARAVAFTMRIGPLASRLRDAPDATRREAESRLADAFAPLVADGAVRVGWTAWVVTALA